MAVTHVSHQTTLPDMRSVNATVPIVAVGAIADTVWQLQRDFGIAHRDIKPGVTGQVLLSVLS